MTKSGAGLMQCTGNVTNSGTTISAGTLQVDGLLGTNTVTVQSGATLAGTGIISAAATVQSGGTISPGDSGIGTLTFGSTLTLNPGSKTLIEIRKLNPSLTNDLIKVASLLTLGGTLIVTNIGTNAFAAGDTIKFFNAGDFSSSFSSSNLPPLATNLVWDTSKLATNGSLTVAASPALQNPLVTQISLGSNQSIVLDCSGVAGQTYYLLAGQNLLSAGSWLVIDTNAAGSNGVFQFMDSSAASFSNRFYRLRSQ
jgi:hypothetical protein